MSSQLCFGELCYQRTRTGVGRRNQGGKARGTNRGMWVLFMFFNYYQLDLHHNKTLVVLTNIHMMKHVQKNWIGNSDLA